MEIDKEAVEAANKYALEAVYWGDAYDSFLAGVKWREENPKPVSGELEERAARYQLKIINDSTRPPSEREWEALNRYYGFKDGAISERGRIRERLREVRKVLTDFSRDHVRCWRAREGLQIIDELLGEK